MSTTIEQALAKYETENNEDFFSGKEYIWGCTLTKENPTYTWQMDEDEDEKDFLTHTLFLKHLESPDKDLFPCSTNSNAVLGVTSVKGQRNVVEVTTKNAEDKPLKIPIISLTLGQNDMSFIDLCFGQVCPATFTLIEGEGPLSIIGQESVEYPEDGAGDLSQDEEDIDEEIGTEEEEDLEEEVPKVAAVVNGTKKRKAQPATNGKAKKGKLDNVTAEDSDEEMDSGEDEVDDEEDDDDDEEASEESEDDSSPDKKKKVKGGKKAQAKPKAAAKVPAKKEAKAKPAAVKKVSAKKTKAK